MRKREREGQGKEKGGKATRIIIVSRSEKREWKEREAEAIEIIIFAREAERGRMTYLWPSLEAATIVRDVIETPTLAEHEEGRE